MDKPLPRRVFLKQTAKAAAVAGLTGCGPLLQGCFSKKQFDWVVKNGLVYDGLGGPPVRADIAVAGDLIRKIGRVKASQARGVIDAQGLAVSAGFIDVHDHSDISLLVNPRAESLVHQGITLVVSGQCGSSPFPIAEVTFDEEKENIKAFYEIDLDWKNLTGFFARLETSGIAMNYATLVGHGSIRGAVMGFGDRPPTPEELKRMVQLVEECIRAGAFGMSTGLEYAPGSFAGADEIVELCRGAAATGGVYATHMRDEGDGLLESLEEAIETARLSGIRLQISHFKAAYPRNWAKLGPALAKIEQAKEDGVDIFCDRYPYIAGSTGLSLYFPMWSKEGTTDDFIRRLQDPALDSRLRAHLASQEEKIGSWDKILLSSIPSEKKRHLQGKTVLEAAGQAGKKPYDFMRDLLIEEKAMVGMIAFMMAENNLKKVLAHPLVGVGCDGSAVAPYGILSRSRPHPRNYGTFPRILGKYVREEKIVPAEEMIRKMTSVPASRFGFERRGVIRPGAFADLVIFDPERIADRATWVEPHQYPVGIEYVIVNGQVVIEGGEHTGLLPGRVLRKKV
ncbi:MAG: D-aminoacylase [Candidatus Aminicenantales bacterium]